MDVISIQSQVVYGHVGNNAAVFPMQLLDADVIAVPTTLLSNNPHYPTLHGGPVGAAALLGLLTGVRERNVLPSCRFILSGYLGTAANGRVVADFVMAAKAANPNLRYCCDPVMGDVDLGFFVRPDLPAVFQDRLVGLADLITPNQFEFEHLVRGPVRSVADVVEGVRMLRRLGTRDVVVTGMRLDDTPQEHLDVVAIEGTTVWRVTTPRLPVRPPGTGDLFTGILVARLVRGEGLHAALGHAASATYAVLEDTMRADAQEMRIVRSAERIVAPERRFQALPAEPR